VRSTLDELAKELAELRALVASITPVNLVLAGHHDSLVRQYLTIRRRFDYAALVVALYASFEKFAENLVAAYARLAAQRSQYAALPTGLTRKHMAKSAEILARGRLGEGRYAGVRELDMVKNLFDCLSGATPYALNDIAIVAHELNLRYEEIGKLFAAVGIEQMCERSRRADAMVAWFCASNSLEQPPQDGVPAATVQQRLDDLVERRNQITHRGGSPVELLGTTEMTDLVDFIEALATSIFALTVASYLRGRHVESGEAAQLQLREGPYRHGAVVVVARPEQRLYVGQPVFALVESAGARWGRILDLQLNDVSTSAVDKTTTAAEVGVLVNFKCPKSVELFVLDAEDDVVWSPQPSNSTVAIGDALIDS
jgi:RiboL-PSP-HEPN